MSGYSPYDVAVITSSIALVGPTRIINAPEPATVFVVDTSGGTGTGAAPIVASIARELGILTVAVVTKPFQYEGHRRMSHAEEGIRDLGRHVDTLLIIPNQNLFRVANEKTTFADAFATSSRDPR